MADYKFPTEVVDLPSKGYFYVDGHPLSKGKVEVKYMTAKEEDILTSQNLIQQGTVIDVLLQSLIVDKTINVQDLLIGDKNAIMLAARILGYGKEYDFEYDGVEQQIDLSKLEPVNIDLSKCTKGQNQFSYDLPNSKRKITFKLLTGHDENRISAEIKAMQKISKDRSSELTTRFKTMISSVDGNSEQSYINNFVDNEFLSRDSLVFRRHLTEITPDMDMTTTIVDSNGKETEVAIPVTVRFFGLPPEYKLKVHEEIFQLILHSKGGFTFNDTYNLPIYLRTFYLKRLQKFYKTEAEEFKKEMNKYKN